MNGEHSLAGNHDKGTGEIDGNVEQSSLGNRIGQIFNDEIIMRTAFYGLVVGVGITLFLDYRAMVQANETVPVVTPRTSNPVLPAFVPDRQDEEDKQKTLPQITTPGETLNQPMRIELQENGILAMTGFIDVGTANIFEKEIENITEYITTVQLNSPGGSVFDALAISDRIREQGWRTTVLKGHLCASSCPLIFAGGKKRIADEGAGIGVHQFFSISEDTRSPSETISGTQTTTARITRHLEKMEVDPSLWIHAMETPPQQLYYFSREELEKFKLVTGDN